MKNAKLAASLFFLAALAGCGKENKEADMTSHPVNSEIACFQTLAANRLAEAYEEDGLKGKLKEIAANLNEESNPVLMLVRNKKPGN